MKGAKTSRYILEWAVRKKKISPKPQIQINIISIASPTFWGPWTGSACYMVRCTVHRSRGCLYKNGGISNKYKCLAGGGFLVRVHFGDLFSWFVSALSNGSSRLSFNVSRIGGHTDALCVVLRVCCSSLAPAVINSDIHPLFFGLRPWTPDASQNEIVT